MQDGGDPALALTLFKRLWLICHCDSGSRSRAHEVAHADKLQFLLRKTQAGLCVTHRGVDYIYEITVIGDETPYILLQPVSGGGPTTSSGPTTSFAVAVDLLLERKGEEECEGIPLFADERGDIIATICPIHLAHLSSSDL